MLVLHPCQAAAVVFPVKAVIARRDTLLALFDLVADVQPDIAVKLLRTVKHLTRDPSMLLPLYVRTSHALSVMRLTC